MKLKSGFVLRNIADKCIIVPVGEESINFSGLMTLNKSGKFLFGALLLVDSSVESLTQQLMEHYDCDETSAKLDVEAFVNKLKEKNIIE